MELTALAQVRGYIYIYLSNESNTIADVYFDDLKINHTGAYVSQATDYGVWGDVMREQKSEPDDMYRWYYQGQFAEKDEETGWNHFELREYDPMIGRWTVVDPKRIGWSPYIGMYNNPVGGTDPDGGGPDDIIIKDSKGNELTRLITDQIDAEIILDQPSATGDGFPISTNFLILPQTN